jgi:hypothetical protein
MAAATKAMTGGSSELILAADEHRDYVTLQLQGWYSVYLAFGEPAVNETGIMLIVPGCSVRVMGAKARLPIYGYANGETTVGIETCEDVEYRPGSFIWFWA